MCGNKSVPQENLLRIAEGIGGYEYRGIKRDQPDDGPWTIVGVEIIVDGQEEHGGVILACGQLPGWSPD